MSSTPWRSNEITVSSPEREMCLLVVGIGVVARDAEGLRWQPEALTNPNAASWLVSGHLRRMRPYWEFSAMPGSARFWISTLRRWWNF